jgi:hypothetical protein
MSSAMMSNTFGRVTGDGCASEATASPTASRRVVDRNGRTSVAVDIPGILPQNANGHVPMAGDVPVTSSA